jgi:hypothetical protein
VDHLLSHQSLNDKIHTDKEETNACHLAMYHHDSMRGCQHKNHFDKNVESCGFCTSLLRLQTYIPSFSDDVENPQPFFTSSFFLTQEKIVSEGSPTSLRAPPYFI